MSQRQIDIADMQCWVFRHAQEEWKLSPSACADMFKKYNLLNFISECYDLLHVSGYQKALDDIKEILKRKGVLI